MLLIYIALLAAILAGATGPTQRPHKRKASELEIHFANAAAETYYEYSLFNLKELKEIGEDFSRGSRVATDTETAGALLASEMRTSDPTNIPYVTPSAEAESATGLYVEGGSSAVAEAAGASDLATTTVVPSRVEWARERYMLFSYLQTNPRDSLAPLLESIQAQIPGSTMTIERLVAERAEIIAVVVVPTWFHNAMMALEPVGNSFNTDALPWLLSLAPAGSPPFRNSDDERRITAQLWFEFCVTPTRMNPRKGPFCVEAHRPDHYALTRPQQIKHLERLKQLVSRFF